MNEQTKKVLLGVVIAVAVVIAVIQGAKLFSEPKIEIAGENKPIPKGQGMKAREKAMQGAPKGGKGNADASNMAGSVPPPPDTSNVAGSIPPPPGG